MLRRTPRTELFPKVVYCRKPLTIMTKISVLDVGQNSEFTSERLTKNTPLSVLTYSVQIWEDADQIKLDVLQYFGQLTYSMPLVSFCSPN